ncbi:50S ribosomal protein L10 [Kamptonema cortianum]|nr:50S ribosomal protein L10 [Kamptonema cortianum]MDL5050065.1 50S ribosomal protein L10 [Oscillatoria amoena NRMC-F 0135]
MRPEKTILVDEIKERINASPYLIVTEYSAMTVVHFNELRKRLRDVEAEYKVIKNTALRIAAEQAGLPDLKASLSGQIAIVTGQKDVSAAAKVVKTFAAEFEKPAIKLGVLDNRLLSAADVKALADLPSLDVLRAKLLGLFNAPATKLAVLLNTPGSQLAQVIKAKGEKGA